MDIESCLNPATRELFGLDVPFDAEITFHGETGIRWHRASFDPFDKLRASKLRTGRA